jgi:hypothetical protein
VVTLLGATIDGGTLNTTSGGLIQAANSRCCTPVLNGVTNLGTYQIPDDNGTTLMGAITNSGNIQLNSAGSFTSLAVSGAVTLTGGGSITLSDNGENVIQAAVSGSSLTNVNNTISGSGIIGDNSTIGFTNLAAGVVNATSSAGNSLTIGTTSGVVNLGLLEASAGGTLVLSGTGIDAMTPTTVVNTNGTTNGTIEALNGGTVLLGNVNILGGTITTTGTGVMLAEGAQLAGTANTVTNAGNLQVPNGYYLNIQGAIDNTGTLALNSAGGFTSLYVNSPTATLEGSGTVSLSDNPNNRIWAENSGSQLTIGQTQTIQGPGGNIGVGNLVLVNQGTIDATASAFGNSLTIQPLTSLTNTGLLEATGGGSLALYGATILNGGGTITSGSGSNVTLEAGVTVTGGTLNGAGLFTSVYGALNGVTNAGNVQISNSGELYISGTINNTGTLAVNSAGNSTELYVNSPTATLQGGGTVTLSDSNNNYIVAATSGNQLTVAQTIQGPGGNIGGGSLVLVNQGTIDATASAFGNTLTIQPLATLTNTGLLEATGGGSLALDGATVANSGASIMAASGSTVTLEGGVTVIGGTLSGAGLFTSVNSTLNNLTNAGIFQIPNNDSATLAGTIKNTGSLQLNSGGNSTLLSESGAVTLMGGGTLILSDNNSNSLTATTSGGGSLTNVNNVISGSGNIGNGNLGFTNQAAGVVNATSANGNSLIINPGPQGATNAGIFEASSGGTLVLENSISNASGTIEGLAGTGANAGGAVVVDGATITGGTLSALGTGVNAASVIAENGAVLSGITTNGTIQIPNNNGASLAGTVTNNGSLQVNSTGYATYLYINGNTTLNGSGTIVLSNNPNNYMRGASGTELLTNNGNTIEGSGTISALGIINNATGTILANQPAELFIQPNSNGFTNNGTVQVNAGSTLDITGGPFTNFNSGTGTLTGGTYNVSGTLQFDNANIVTNAANITLTGASAQIVGNTNANALAGFTNNSAAGIFRLASGASVTTVGGSFTNTGSFTVGSGSTFTVGGSSFNYTQTAGSTVVNGALTSTTLGTLAVNGGSLDGVGTLGYNVVDASTLTPGDSSTVTGKLTVADTYTQSSSGALDIQINGATAGTKYDQLKVTQGATLGGTLNISLGAGFTPTVGETFVILAAASVSDTFANVNGLAINGSEHFTVAYGATGVVLTVVSGALAASTNMLSRLIHPAPIHGSSVEGHYGLPAPGPSLARLPSTIMAKVPAASAARLAPVSLPVSFASPATGVRGFHPMDQFSSLAVASAPVSTGDASGSFGIAPVSAASYNSVSASNHMRFECGVDLKALLKTSRKQLLRGLWAAPDSPDALAIGYVAYTGAH